MKSLHEQHMDIIRRWQGGKKTPELAKEFDKISTSMISEPRWVTYEDHVYATQIEIFKVLDEQKPFKDLTNDKLRSAFENLGDSESERRSEMLAECRRRFIASLDLSQDTDDIDANLLEILKKGFE